MLAAAVRRPGRARPMMIGLETCTIARASKVPCASRSDGGAGTPRRATALLALTAAMLLGLPAVASLTARAQEPVILTGSWVGTWWIGKYEEPVELELTHTRRSLEGQVTLWGYPRAGSTSAAAPVRAPVAGTVDGDRVELTWTMPEQGPFRA